MPAPLLRLFRPWAGLTGIEGAQLVIEEDGVRVNRTPLVHNASQFSWSNTQGQRGPAQIPLILKNGQPYSPKIGWPVFIYELDTATETSICVYIGTIEDRKVRWLSDAADSRVWDLSALSLEAMMDAVPTPPATYTAQTTGDIFTSVFNGNTYPVPVALGTVQPGATIATRTYDGTSSSAANFNTLTVDAGGDFVWYIDPRDQLAYFHVAGARVAPVILTSDKVLFGTLEYEQSRSDFRDRQVIQVPGVGTVTVSNTSGTDLGIGTRFQVLPLAPTTTVGDATAQANAILAQQSSVGGLPASFSFSSDYPGWYAGLSLVVALTYPPDAATMLNGSNWLIQDVQAVWIPGREGLQSPKNHFRYTVKCVNSVAIPSMQESLSSFVVPAIPGPQLTTQPATWGGGGGANVSGLFMVRAGLSDTTVGAAVTPLVPIAVALNLTSSPLAHYVGHGVEIIGVLSVAITADLDVTITSGANTWMFTIPLATAVGDPVSMDISGSDFHHLDIVSLEVTASDGQIVPNGVCTFTLTYSVTVVTS